MGPQGQKYGFELLEALGEEILIERDPSVDLDARAAEPFNFPIKNRPWKPIVGDAPSQHSAGKGRTFKHLDATDLSGIKDRAFDYATVLLLLHELGREKQLQVLSEAARVAERIILVDSCVPLPWNFNGLVLRTVEATFGLEHNPNFRGFLASGGIPALVEDWGRQVDILHRSIFWRGCREVVMLSQASG